uniref:DNA-directed RNA polymerase n=1 Tax=Eudorina sp. NIES-3984 TaxID=1941220 RepID=A0A385KPR5_9CHLO|nr:RNA polymerase subunit alpha [Eudorina sp. NIES-3984]
MIPNTNFKNIMAKTQTTDFFIACKESRIENNTSFYGCFYLGPFDNNLSQTLANDIRRTLLSELSGLAITSIEIEGILHKFSSLPGMKETVLDLICNLQNIVLKKQKFSSKIKPLDYTKKTYIGFLNVSGPRIIKAIDLKLPSGLQCVDPNQYIATLAEDGLLNMKIFINEGKNFIKQKPYNLDVNVLKKRNILLQNFKKKTQLLLLSKRNYNQKIKTNLVTNKNLSDKPNNSITLQVKTSISNPIPLDAVFMPVTKINCIIEENNLYFDFNTDIVNTYNQIFDDKIQLHSKSNLITPKVIYKKQPRIGTLKSNLPLSHAPINASTTVLNTIDYNSIYQTCLVLEKIKNISEQKNNKQVFSFQQQTKQFLDDNNKNTRLEKQNYFKLIPWQSDSLYFDINDMPTVFDSKGNKKLISVEAKTYKNNYRLWLSKEHGWFSLGKNMYYYPSFDVVPQKVQSHHVSFSKIKNFLACKTSKNNQSKTNQVHTTEKQSKNFYKKIIKNITKKNYKILFCKTISNIFKNIFKIQNPNLNPMNQQTMYLEYAKNIKLKPLRKKSHLIVEVWTNGSIHPRQALYQCFTFLSNNFLKLQTVKMLGTMFKSELAYGNLKYSIRNNYNVDPIKKINFDKKNQSLFLKTRDFRSMSFAFDKINLLYDQPNNILIKKTSFNQMKFYSQASLKAPIDILKISLRAYTALKKAGILTINDLINCSKKDLLKINNLEKKSLVLIETNLSYFGLTLKK